MTNEEMTSEKAVELLENIKSRVECFDVYIDEEEGEALDLAIKAIKENEAIKEAYRIMRGDL